MSLLARRYAAALFAVAEERGATEAVLADLHKLAAAFAMPDAAGLLGDPTVARPELAKVVDRFLAGGTDLARNAAHLLLERRRGTLIPALAAELQALQRQKAGEVEAVVRAARAVDETELAKLRAQLEGATGKRVVMRIEIDPDLLAGVRVRVGNTLYDGSLQGELEELHRQLLQSSVNRN